ATRLSPLSLHDALPICEHDFAIANFDADCGVSSAAREQSQQAMPAARDALDGYVSSRSQQIENRHGDHHPERDRRQRELRPELEITHEGRLSRRQKGSAMDAEFTGIAVSEES